MTFSCDKGILFEAVNTVIKTIAQKSSVPVLEGIFIEIEKTGSLKLIGSDVDISTEVMLEAEQASENEKFIVPAKTFFDMLNKMDSGIVFFNLDEKRVLHMVCGVIKYDLPTLDADMYPSTPMVEQNERIVIKKSVLFDMLKKTLFAVSQNDARPILKGALFNIEENIITVVTSDTFRLALSSAEFVNENASSFSFVVPGRALSEITKMIKPDDLEVIINCATTHILFEFDNVKVTTRLLSGEFSNYKSIMPKSYKTEITFNVADLKRAVERASVLISEKIKNPVKVSLEENTIIVSCRTQEGMSLVDEVEAAIEGDRFEIGFNDKFLLDVLNVLGEEKAVIKMNSPVAPVCINPLEKQTDIFIVSPMRIK